MKKLDSIYRLDSLGLNVPEILHYHPLTPTPEDELKLKHVLAQEQRQGHRISVRTEKPDEFKSPFCPNSDIPTARKFIDGVLGKGYEILICRGLPTNSLIRGNCVPSSKSNYFEYLTGPGTVRDIDESGRTPKTIDLRWGQYPEGVSQPVSSGLQLINSRLFPQRFELGNEVVEFTVFSKPVGILQNKEIFWEVRVYGGTRV